MRINYFILLSGLFSIFSVKSQAQYPYQQPEDSALIDHPYLHDLLPLPIELNGQYGLNVGDVFPENFSLFSKDHAHYTKSSIIEEAISNNKVVVLLAGNITCPGARMLIDSIRSLDAGTLSKILLVFINNSEAHPVSGASPFAQVEGESLEIDANIPDYMFPQTNYYCDQYYRVDSLRELYDLPDDWIYLLDGPECPFGIDFAGPFGMLIINPFTSLIEYEFPNISSGIEPDPVKFINAIDHVQGTVSGMNTNLISENSIAPNPLTPTSKWIGNKAASEIVLVDMYGQIAGKFNSDDFSKIEVNSTGIYTAYIYNSSKVLIATQKVKIE